MSGNFGPVKAVFLMTSDVATKILTPYAHELARSGEDVLLYHSGPVCEEIRDRNVVVTVDRERDADIISGFGCGVVCLSEGCSADLGLMSIKREATKGGV